MTNMDRKEAIDRLDAARDAIIEAISWLDPDAESEGAGCAMRALVEIRMVRIELRSDDAAPVEEASP